MELLRLRTPLRSASLCSVLGDASFDCFSFSTFSTAFFSRCGIGVAVVAGGVMENVDGWLQGATGEREARAEGEGGGTETALAGRGMAEEGLTTSSPSPTDGPGASFCNSVLIA